MYYFSNKTNTKENEKLQKVENLDVGSFSNEEKTCNKPAPILNKKQPHKKKEVGLKPGLSSKKAKAANRSSVHYVLRRLGFTETPDYSPERSWLLLLL